MAYLPEGRFERVMVYSLTDTSAVAGQHLFCFAFYNTRQGSLTGEVGHLLQVVGVVARHEGDGDGTLGVTPLKGERGVLLDLIVRVEKDRLRERGGREGENGSDGELHCD
jgi:hypothetical protein